MKLLLLSCLIALVAYATAGRLATFKHAKPAADEQPGNIQVPRLADTRIVGGKVVPIALHPHQVSLRYKSIFSPQNPYSHRCGGSIYSEDIIITAAHCVIATVPSQFQVVAGTNNRRGNDGYIAPVKEIIMHENYDPNALDNDIAILVLRTPLPLDNYTVGSIELADQDARDGAIAFVTGWGTTQEGGAASNELQEVRVPIVSNEICNEDYDGMITDSMLCAGVRGVGGKDACQGDSGGPLLVNGKLAGIVSWGYGCARPEFPGVYAKVSYLHPWIMTQITNINNRKLN